MLKLVTTRLFIHEKKKLEFKPRTKEISLDKRLVSVAYDVRKACDYSRFQIYIDTSPIFHITSSFFIRFLRLTFYVIRAMGVLKWLKYWNNEEHILTT